MVNDSPERKWRTLGRCDDRDVAFDPWIYVPLAKLECKLRGPDVQVVLDGSRGRDGSAMYVFGWASQNPDDP